MATANNDVVTKKYLDQQIAAIPEPEIPDENKPFNLPLRYDGNRYSLDLTEEDCAIRVKSAL